MSMKCGMMVVVHIRDSIQFGTVAEIIDRTDKDGYHTEVKVLISGPDTDPVKIDDPKDIRELDPNYSSLDRQTIGEFAQDLACYRLAKTRSDALLNTKPSLVPVTDEESQF